MLAREKRERERERERERAEGEEKGGKAAMYTGAPKKRRALKKPGKQKRTFAAKFFRQKL